MKKITNFKETIKKLRKEAGLTQKECSQALNIPFNRYADYERGHRTPYEAEQLEVVHALEQLALHDFIDMFLAEI